MPDPRFFAAHAPIAFAEAAAAVGADAPAREGAIVRVASLAEDDIAGALVYCADEEAFSRLEGRPFGLCLATAALAEAAADGAVLAVESPKRAFAVLAARLHHSLDETDPDAEGDAQIDAGARVHPSAVIASGAEIGARAQIGAHCRIGRGVVIGEETRVEAGVTITHAILGREVSVLPGARIGQAGFGFVESANGLLRIVQLGRVVIGDDVEIGANTTIDRGALDDTVVGDGAKIDNLVQIGHNSRIGRYCVIAGQTGISGSCVIGDGVMIGGQGGVADHVRVGDGARIAAKAGVMRDVPAGARFIGAPARPAREFLREVAALARLAKKDRR